MRLQFDDLTFDSDTRQVWAGKKEVRLSPKAFDLLALLVARRPKAVSKADIREHLWPGTFVSDSSLPSLVSEIRDAIVDHRRKPGLLRTLHGFGYAFQAEQGSATKTEVAPNDSTTAWLIGSTAEVALLRGENIIGREGDGLILVKSSTVSRRHARLAIDASGAVVEDLGSKNGTYVNDRRINSPTPVVNGDQIRIGSLLFTFRLSEDSETTETQSSRSGRLRS
ncbi:MAG TPA: FHA domain-containing protein [Vicinamibacterales bacterium]|nr:FHA domain-containing protein [Vicinamibacterales bacterium]